MRKIFLLSFFCFVCIDIFAENPKKSIREIIKGLSEIYHLNIYYLSIPDNTWGTDVSCKIGNKKDYKDLLKYLLIFKEEFEKYSQQYIKKTGLRSVVFCKELAYLGQERAALPDAFKETLFYDFLLGSYNPTYQRHVVHHEFYHMIEEQFFKDFYYKDPIWSSFNSNEHKYGDGGSTQRGSDQYPITHPKEGFINLYSTSGLEEDKAEVYAILWVEDEKKQVFEWLEEDKILKRKINYMQEFIKKIETE